MASPSSSLDVPFIAGICAYPTREALCCECPALLLLVYEHVVAEVQAGRRAADPFRGTSRQDNLSELLAVRSVAEVFTHLYPDPSSGAGGAGSNSSGERGKESLGNAFWRQTRKTLEAAWASPYDASARAVLTQVRDQPHFSFTAAPQLGSLTPGCGLPLQPVSLEKALSTSKRFLRAATTCALDGSTEALKGGQPELQSVLQLARLVPHNAGTAAARSSSSMKEVTPEGLNFCMVSLQQRWWVLVSGALERALILTRGDATLAHPAGGGSAAVTKPLLWQLLAVLAVLDSAQYIFAFPDKQSDPAGHHLLARLSEVGLIYPLLSESRRCFAVSPDFLHALHWHASAPLSLTFTQQLVRGSSGAGSGGGGGGDVRREDADTIITETNFRLYAYTHDADLLNIIHQFAVLEEVVNASLYCFRVTRDSFAAAMRKGISATQVLRFLSLRAHPSMLRRSEDAAAAAEPSSLSGVGAGHQRSGAAVVDAVATLVVPQSFCDQVRMWESECRRVVFEHRVALLRNMTAEQQTGVTQFLMEAGEADAVVHVEVGYMVLRAEVYGRLVAPLLE